MKKEKQNRTGGTTSKGIPLIDENNIADINQVNTSFQKIDELVGNNEEIEQHKNLSIVNENGVHNFKYDPSTKSFYYNQDGTWHKAEIEGTGDVSVSGLTPETLKTGVTAIIMQGQNEIKRISGTFTRDATAISSDILSGKTAYVNGNKITGNMPVRSGEQVVSITGSKGDLIVTGNIANAYYQNCTIGIRKGNLLPENIKKGVNIFGVNGTFGGAEIVAVIQILIVNRKCSLNFNAVDSSLVSNYNVTSDDVAYNNLFVQNLFRTSLNLTLRRWNYYHQVSYGNGLEINIGSYRYFGNELLSSGSPVPLSVNTSSNILIRSSTSFSTQGYSDAILLTKN